MLRLTASLVAMGMGLALCGMAEAGHGSGGRGSSGGSRGSSFSSRSFSSSRSMSSSSFRNSSFRSNSMRNSSFRSSKFSGKFNNYHMKNGTKFSHGYYYKGQYHNHWSKYCWNSSYGCYLYYDPCCFSWYYWCPVAFCYYPVSYCPYGTYYWGTEVVATADAPVTATAETGAPVDSDQEPPQPPAPVNGKNANMVTPQGQPNISASTTPTVKEEGK